MEPRVDTESPSPARSLRRDLGLLAAALVAVAVVAGLVYRGSAGRGTGAVPPFTGAAPAGAERTGTETAVFAGGCFWGVQGVFQHVKGVRSAVSGYAGGEAGTAVYERVGRGDTGHAEAVEVTFDPREVSYAQLLQVFFAVAHDPTQLDRQGPDFGPQYRSALFPRSDAQASIARAYIAQLGEAKVFGSAIVTKLEDARPFFPAEAYHQDFMTRHPDHPYIAVHDRPKLAALQRQFPALFRVEPVLVGP